MHFVHALFFEEILCMHGDMCVLVSHAMAPARTERASVISGLAHYLVGPRRSSYHGLFTGWACNCSFFSLLFSANEHPAIVDTIVYMILEKNDMYIWLPAASNPFSCVREYLMYMALLYS